jgi:hypothetical protein
LPQRPSQYNRSPELAAGPFAVKFARFPRGASCAI